MKRRGFLAGLLAVPAAVRALLVRRPTGVLPLTENELVALSGQARREAAFRSYLDGLFRHDLTFPRLQSDLHYHHDRQWFS